MQNVYILRRTRVASAIARAFATLSVTLPVTLPVTLILPTTAMAQSSTANLSEVVVTANPLGSDLNQLVSPVSTMQGDALAIRQSGTLGETRNGLPGVSSTYLGPNASRPVIRGLDGDRIRVLQNGGTSLDAASLSFDHAVPIDPLLTERIEVVRGPAALLYGGNAIGGVVNVIDNRIPKAPIEGVTGAVEGRAGGAERERSIGGLVEAGNGQFAIHADAFTRRTSDLRIPGFARSERRRNAGPPENGVEPQDRLPNSDARTSGGALGASMTGPHGYLGASLSGYDSDYGTVAEESVRIKMKQQRFALEGERSELGGWIESVKGKFGYSDYEHREQADGVTGTIFRNRGFDSRIEARHKAIGRMQGVFGAQFGQSKFSALGDEAFVPTVETNQAALFVFEEMPLDTAGDVKLNVGGRVERTGHDAQAGDNPRFTDAKRRFTAGSASAGLLVRLNPAFTLTSNVAYTERAPTFYELYANGPHVATGVYEVGHADAAKEKATSIDLGMRFRQGAHSAGVSAYYSRFSNYLALGATGRSRDAEGELVAPDADGALPEFQYAGIPAEMMGLEADGKLRLAQKLLSSGDTLDLEVRGDVVRGKNRDTGEALPRLAPYRLGSALAYGSGPWKARLDVSYSAKQNRVPLNDSPTDSYTLLGASISYAFKWNGARTLVYLRGDNLTNAEARSASSFLRDIAPLGGRSVKVGLKTVF